MDAHTQELLAESERLLRGEPESKVKTEDLKTKPRKGEAKRRKQRRPKAVRRQDRPRSRSRQREHDGAGDGSAEDSLVYSEDETGDFYRFADDETIAREQEEEAEAKARQDALDVKQAERDAVVASKEIERSKTRQAQAKKRAKRRSKPTKTVSFDQPSAEAAARLKRNSIAEIATEQRQLVAEAARAAAKKKTKPALLKPAVPGPAPPRSNGGENAALGDREWENELARSILTLYNANSINEAKERTARTARTTPSSRRSRNKAFWQLHDQSPKQAPSSPKHLQTNVSLPSLPPSTAPEARHEAHTTRSTATLHKALKAPKQIWFYGSGRLRAVWCAISNQHLRNDMQRLKGLDPTRCSHRLCRELREIEKKTKYEEYIERALEALREFSREATHDRAERRREAARKLLHPSTSTADGGPQDPMELHTCDLKPTPLAQASELSEMKGTQDAYMIDYATLDPSLLADDDDNGGGLVERMMWRQLVACCNIFGTKLCDLGRFGSALQLFKQAEDLLESTSAIDGGAAFVGAIRTQLRAFTNDALGYYYYKRKKTNAASLYTQKAMRAHHRLGQWDHVAKCHLHCGAILALMGKHDEAIKCLAQILDMVDDDRLQVGGTNAQKICMVAVCYHNIAVEQLVLRRPAEACVSSQNARRLARLSLSYANRWINWFERTHQYALQRLAAQHSYVTAGKQTTKPPTASQQRHSLKNPSLQKFYGGLARALE